MVILQTISYMAERVVGHGSFGVVFQVSFGSCSFFESLFYETLSDRIFLLLSGEMLGNWRNCCDKESSSRSEVQEP